MGQATDTGLIASSTPSIQIRSAPAERPVGQQRGSGLVSSRYCGYGDSMTSSLSTNVGTTALGSVRYPDELTPAKVDVVAVECDALFVKRQPHLDRADRRCAVVKCEHFPPAGI